LVHQTSVDSTLRLPDHPNVANAGNMHDLCLKTVPHGARFSAIRFGANLIRDPNGDPNLLQRFRVSH